MFSSHFFDIVSGKIPIFCGMENELGLKYRVPYQIPKKRFRARDNDDSDDECRCKK